MKKRIKVSAVHSDFIKELNRFKRFDGNNQRNYQNSMLTTKQMHILVESSFFSVFREYENFIRDIFLLYTQEKPRANGTKVRSYLRPTDFFHAEKLMKSSMNFLDWNTPDTIIERSEVYLKDGFPIKSAYTINRVQLINYKKLRNHIAHNSLESLSSYKKVLRSYYGTTPLVIPAVGEYLLLTSKSDPNKYNLLEFFDLIENMANNVI